MNFTVIFNVLLDLSKYLGILAIGGILGYQKFSKGMDPHTIREKRQVSIQDSRFLSAFHPFFYGIIYRVK